MTHATRTVSPVDGAARRGLSGPQRAPSKTPRPAHRLRALSLTLLALVSIAGSGCGINRRYANDVIRQLPHEEVAIEYTWQPTPIGPNGHLVGDSKRVIHIQYPHPNSSYGNKYAEVIVRSPGQSVAPSQSASRVMTAFFRPKDSGSDEPVDDGVIRSSLTREELNTLLRDIVADGFFDREERRGNVELGVTFGSRTLEKPWDKITALEELAERVETDYAQRAQSRRSRPASVSSAVELLAPIVLEGDLGTDVQPASTERALDLF